MGPLPTEPNGEAQDQQAQHKNRIDEAVTRSPINEKGKKTHTKAAVVIVEYTNDYPKGKPNLSGSRTE